MLELDFSKCKGAKFKHEIGAQLRGIWPDLELSHCARDVGVMWMSATLYSFGFLEQWHLIVEIRKYMGNFKG